MLVAAAAGLGAIRPTRDQLCFAGAVFVSGCSLLALAKPVGTVGEQIAYLGFLISLAAACLLLGLHGPEWLSRALLSLAFVFSLPFIVLVLWRRTRDLFSKSLR
jgi:hypothetical protein